MNKIKYWYHAVMAYIPYRIWWEITNHGDDEKETRFRYFLLKRWDKHARALTFIRQHAEDQPTMAFPFSHTKQFLQ